MEIIDMVKEYITPELLVLIPVLYFFGAAMKKSAKLADEYIPAALGVCGVVLALLWVLATSPFAGPQSVAMAAFTAIVQGALAAAGAVYINQIKKQAEKA